MKNISLRKFRVEIVDIHEAVEVSRRDPEGNIQLLGFWTPYMTSLSDAKPLEHLETQPSDFEPHALEIPVDRMEHRIDTGPRFIRTPAEAAIAVKPSPVRAFPKEAQTGRKRK